MKSESLSYWPIIRWASVGLIYAGTIAIAVDQVRTKDRELMVAEGKLAKQRVALGRLANDAVDLRTDVAGIAAAHQQSQAQLVAIQSQMRLLEAMRKTDVAVKNHLESQAVRADSSFPAPRRPPSSLKSTGSRARFVPNTRPSIRGRAAESARFR